MAVEKTVHENDKAYEALKDPTYRKVQVTFEIALDAMPGWGDKVEDHIQAIFNADPYVLKATVEA